MRDDVLSCIDQVSEELGPGPARLLLEVLRDSAATDAISLPPFPDAVHQVCALVDAPRCDLLQVAQAVGSVPGIAERVIEIANSAFFGGHDCVHTVRDSMVRMGIRETRNVVVGLALRQIFWSVPGFEHAVVPLWQHSLATAAAAQGILCEVAFDDHTGFITGLTHDIGRVAVLGVLASSTELPRLRRSVPGPVADRVIDAIHAELGALVLEQWGFPRRMVVAVRCHHSPDAAEGPEKVMAAALQTADWMAHRFSDTRAGSPLGADPLDVWLEEFGITPERATALMTEGRARFDELMKVL
jgi:HD-like signal output (HDOD) protein